MYVYDYSSPSFPWLRQVNNGFDDYFWPLAAKRWHTSKSEPFLWPYKQGRGNTEE
jgi:hypothetical protein